MEEYIFWYKLVRDNEIKYIASHWITPEEAMKMLEIEFRSR